MDELNKQNASIQPTNDKGKNDRKKMTLLSFVIITLGVCVIVFMSLFITKCSASNTHIVTFDTLGGSHIDSIRVKDGSTVEKPEDPTKIDYYFGGWFISQDYAGRGYDFNTPVTKDITLYAEWFNATEFAPVTFDGGENSFIEGVNFKTPIYKTYARKGIKFFNLYKDLKYMGASVKGQDFLYWTINGEKVPNDCVIPDNGIRFNAKYTSTRNDYLTITARVDNCTLLFNESVYADDGIQYSKNGINWFPFTADTLQVELESIGDQIYLKKDNENAISGPIINNEPEATRNMPFSISGSIESFIHGKTTTPESMFQDMFFQSPIVSAANLQFDKIEELATSSCENMFKECDQLIAAPELPTPNLAVNCYMNMFWGCSSLVVAPTLPAQVLKESCYSNMFQGCSSLVLVQKELPITQLANSCCTSMFYGCASLKSAPTLPDNLTLTTSCYNSMFGECTSLRIAENGTIGTKIFTCPSSASGDNVGLMFDKTSGTFKSKTPSGGNTYYYY